MNMAIFFPFVYPIISSRYRYASISAPAFVIVPAVAVVTRKVLHAPPSVLSASIAAFTEEEPEPDKYASSRFWPARSLIRPTMSKISHSAVSNPRTIDVSKEKSN
jgi:hypothetical protein